MPVNDVADAAPVSAGGIETGAVQFQKVHLTP